MGWWGGNPWAFNCCLCPGSREFGTIGLAGWGGEFESELSSLSSGIHMVIPVK